VVATTTNPPPTTPTTPNQGSSDDHHVHERGADPEDVHGGNRQRPIPAPREHGDHGDHGDREDTSATPTVRVPHPRQSDRREGAVERSQTAAGGAKGVDPDSHRYQVPATLTAGADGTLWVTVDGADVREVAARISALCDVLNRAHPPR